MSKNKIDAMYGYLSRHRGYLYPIGTSFLVEATDPLKNSYFTVLAAVLHQGSEITPEQQDLFAQLIAGAKCECASCDYFRQGLELKTEDFVKIAEQYRASPLRYRLILDAAVLSGSGAQSKRQESMITALIDCLQLPKNEAVFLVALAKSTLTKDRAAHQGSEDFSSEIFLSSASPSSAVPANPGSQLTVSGTGGYGIELIEKKGPVKP